jgi:PAS domain S-box-containing protein
MNMSAESIDNRNRVRELELELDRSEQRTRMLIQAIPLAMLIIDGRGTILSVNPQASYLLGWAPKEVAGRKLFDLLATCPLQFPLTADFTTKTFETSLTTKEERVVYVESSISELSRDGDIWLVSLKDVTEQHNIEIFKQNMVQMISHDLRSPLSSLSIFLDIVVSERLGEVPAAVKKQGTIAQNSCQRLLNLVEDLLKVETFTAGTLQLSYQLALSDTILDAAKNSVIELANNRSIQLKVEGRDIEVWCDEDRLVQVLVNFMSNALKFTPDGETITVIARETADGVEFSVNDRGPGIPEAETELVFERFFQGTNNGAGTGFGLGLAICREIVNAHNGTIGVRKNGEKGASFWFKIPPEPREDDQS